MSPKYVTGLHLAKLLVLPPETGLGRNQVGVQLPTQSYESIQRLLLAIKDGEEFSGALGSVLGIKHRPTFRDKHLHPALDAELIEMTIPEKPSSSKQKYRLTDKRTGSAEHWAGEKISIT